MGYRPENNSIATQLRSIDLCVDHDSGNIRQWFFTHQDMCQFLCALKVSAYADTNGSIRDQDGAVIGLWYYAEFSCKYPEFDHDTRKHPIELTGDELAELDSVTGSHDWGEALNREVLEDAEPIGLGREVVDEQQQDYEAMRGNTGYNEMTDALIRQQMSDEAKEDMDEYPDTGHDDCPDCGNKFCMGCDFGLGDAAKKFAEALREMDVKIDPRVRESARQQFVNAFKDPAQQAEDDEIERRFLASSLLKRELAAEKYPLAAKWRRDRHLNDDDIPF